MVIALVTDAVDNVDMEELEENSVDGDEASSYDDSNGGGVSMAGCGCSHGGPNLRSEIKFVEKSKHNRVVVDQVKGVGRGIIFPPAFKKKTIIYEKDLGGATALPKHTVYTKSVGRQPCCPLLIDEEKEKLPKRHEFYLAHQQPPIRRHRRRRRQPQILQAEEERKQLPTRREFLRTQSFTSPPVVKYPQVPTREQYYLAQQPTPQVPTRKQYYLAQQPTPSAPPFKMMGKTRYTAQNDRYHRKMSYKESLAEKAAGDAHYNPVMLYTFFRFRDIAKKLVGDLDEKKGDQHRRLFLYWNDEQLVAFPISKYRILSDVFGFEQYLKEDIDDFMRDPETNPYNAERRLIAAQLKQDLIDVIRPEKYPTQTEERTHLVEELHKQPISKLELLVLTTQFWSVENYGTYLEKRISSRQPEDREPEKESFDTHFMVFLLLFVIFFRLWNSLHIFKKGKVPERELWFFLVDWEYTLHPEKVSRPTRKRVEELSAFYLDVAVVSKKKLFSEKSNLLIRSTIFRTIENINYELAILMLIDPKKRAEFIEKARMVFFEIFNEIAV